MLEKLEKLLSNNIKPKVELYGGYFYYVYSISLDKKSFFGRFGLCEGFQEHCIEISEIKRILD